MAGTKNQKQRERIDRLLVARGLARDLKEAGSFVMAGKVIAGDHRIDKPGSLIDSSLEIRIRQSSRYASRGGDKLEGAVADFSCEGLFRDKVVLDVGASTGGFTDFCLKSGARHVLAVDLGTNQLAWELRTDNRVSVFEQTDIRSFDRGEAPQPEIVVGDVSFVALEKIAAAIVSAGGDLVENYILLVKPQFELDIAAVPKGGVVTDDADRNAALNSAKSAFEQLGLTFVNAVDSRIAGATGNREIFVWFKKKPA